MTSNHNESRKFRIEGSGIMLNALAEAITLALRAARLRPDRTGTGSVTHGHVTIEVAATDEPDGLTYAISSIEDAVRTISGWAETKRCQDCDVPIAMLFDDAYLETPDGDGVVCCRCWRRREDDDEG
jgi:hypothetical protein